MKTLITITLLFCYAFQVQATHIMGGDMTYRYISEDSFEFTFAFYIDCVNGNPGAIASDQFAILGFFNATTKQYIDKVEVERGKPKRVSKLNYACVTPPTSACVDRYEYTFRKRVDVGKDGIIVAFQRCCRNHTITNLVDPGGTGMTLIATIPSENVVSINSNPVFKDSPPNFLCNDAPLVFDHSATDVDGDSLAYDLYLPFKGADANSPRPSQPSNPDYDEVTYTSAYGLSNLMGGSEKLKIDRNTGRLTVVPDKIGQYVVGIRVSEFREGVRIGETLRDYQFNVLACDIKIAANFELPEIKCSDSIIDIINTSSYGDAYFWTVSKQNNIVHNTNDKNPTIKFQNSGVYTIKLVAKNAQCADSVEKDVEIGEVLELNADFTIEVEDTCRGGVVRILNSSDKTADWYWDLGMGAGEQHNITINRYTVDKPGHYTVTLRISDSSKCALDALKTMQFDIHGADTLYAAFEYTFPDNCNPGAVVITKTDDITSKWEWEIDDQQDVFKNETSIELTDIPSGPLKVKLNYEDSELPCTVIEPLQKEIQIDSLDVTVGELLLYNVFTPNDDGINDCFRLDMKDAECYSVALFVYNRWGELLFRTEDAVQECWDGKQKNGEYYPNGTYFGVVKLKHQEMEKPENISIAITFIH